MNPAYLVMDNFFGAATEMRQCLERHFQEPYSHGAQHQIWNYWYVPEQYTYLRTNPEHFMPEPLLTSFREVLNAWAKETLGLSANCTPWISVYVNGCGQGLHNDSRNGQMGFVFSLTRWHERNFLGGETLLFHEENYWGSPKIKQAGANYAFYDAVPSHFNRLLVFDDRVIHGVQPVQGTMNPLAGRVVMHGHLEAGGPFCIGRLSEDEAAATLAPAREEVAGWARDMADRYHGFMTVRLYVEADGSVAQVEPLWDRLLPISSEREAIEGFKQRVFARLAQVRFPEAPGRTWVHLPVMVD